MKKVIVFFLTFYVVAFAEEKCKPVKQFYSDHERGWFYKEVCKEGNEKKENAKKEKTKYKLLEETVVKIPWNIIDKLDPDEIQKLEKKAKKIAVMYPTDHNIKEYQKLIIWIEKKGFKYTENWMRVVRTDTELAREAASVPVSSAARQDYFLSKTKYKKQILDQFKNKAGLVVVVKQGCPYCVKQKQILQLFKLETGWEYKLVDINNVPNMVKKFGIARVPDIFLVAKGDDGNPLWIRIGTGLHTKEELKNLILFGLYNLGLIKPDNKDYVLY